MKTALTSGYTFTASTGILDFLSYSGFDARKLLGIVNITAGGVLIYAPGVSGKGATFSGATVDLATDTSAMSNSDKLLVLYDADVPLPAGAATETTLAAASTALGTAGSSPPTLPGSSTGVIGFLRYLASLFPISIGQKAKAASLAVTLASDDDLLAKVGEVQATPTAYTLLGRLKDLYTAITGTLTVSGSVGLSAGTNVVGSVAGQTAYLDVTLTLDTSAYASGDVMAVTQGISNAMRAADTTAVLQSIQVLDEDDQGTAFDLVFLSANGSIGTLNAAVSVTDTAARDILGFVSIASGDFVDLGGCRIATKSNVGLVVKPASGTRTVYVAAITRGTPTYTASGVRLRLGFLLD